MQKLIIGILLIGAVLTVLYITDAGEPITIDNTPVEETVQTVEEINKINAAQEKLNEAKRLLEEEEQTLLAEIKEKESRLEEIRKVRLSFSQAPEPVR